MRRCVIRAVRLARWLTIDRDFAEGYNDGLKQVELSVRLCPHVAVSYYAEQEMLSTVVAPPPWAAAEDGGPALSLSCSCW